MPLRAAEGVPLRAAADLHHNGTSAMHDHPRDRVHRSAQFDFLDGLRAAIRARAWIADPAQEQAALDTAIGAAIASCATERPPAPGNR